MSYDQKCYDLAEHFLPDTASDAFKKRLAAWLRKSRNEFQAGDR